MKASFVVVILSAYPRIPLPAYTGQYLGSGSVGQTRSEETHLTEETLRTVSYRDTWKTGLALISVVASDRVGVACIGLELVICPFTVSVSPTSGCLRL